MKGYVLSFFVFIAPVLLMFNVSALQADFAIYTGAGTWDASIQAFKNFLDWKGLTWQEVGKHDINRGKLIGNYRALFMPGGWAGDYNQAIWSSGDQHIRNFISGGGAYIGMSAGAFYACDITIWEGNVYDYPSNIFDGSCIGPIEEIAPWPEYTMTTMDMDLIHEANIYEPSQRNVLYYGEPYFVAHLGQEMLTMASWVVPANPVANGAPGIISFNYGQGRVVLVGPHPEIEEDDSRDGDLFGGELSDGPDGSDWPFLWTAIDWLLKDPISQPPGVQPKQCNDGLDNDNDGFIDLSDPGCASTSDDNETDVLPTQCSDGFDNDSDGLIDLNDLGCQNYWDNDEVDPTGPVTLFFDGFENGALNGWGLYGTGTAWSASTDTSFSGSWSARAQQTGAGEDSFMEYAVSAAGYNTVTLEYARKLVGLDTADDFQVEYFANGQWYTLEHLGSASENNANFVSKQFNVLASTSKIRFKCECGAISEKCYVDNVRVLGE